MFSKFKYHHRADGIPNRPFPSSVSYMEFEHKGKTELLVKVRFLGEGAFANTYLFVSLADQPLKKAVKAEKPKPGQPPNKQFPHGKKFHHEGKMWEHAGENCAMSGDPSRTDECHYLAMDYKEGMTLEEFAELNLHLSVKSMIAVFYHVCTKLNKLHTKGIIHQDLSIKNILVKIAENQLHVEIIDLGNACKQNDKAAFYDTNNPRYAPELKVNATIFARPSQDIYALGFTFDDFLKKVNISHSWKDFFSCIISLMTVTNSENRMTVTDAIFCFKQLYEHYDNFENFLLNFSQSDDRIKATIVNTIKPYINNVNFIYAIMSHLPNLVRFKFLAILGKDFIKQELIRNDVVILKNIYCLLPEDNRANFIKLLEVDYFRSLKFDLITDNLIAGVPMKQCLELALLDDPEEKPSVPPIKRLIYLLQYFPEKPRELLNDIGLVRVTQIVSSSAELKELVQQFSGQPEKLANIFVQLIISQTKFKNGKPNETAFADAITIIDKYSDYADFYKQMIYELLETYRVEMRRAINKSYMGIKFFNKTKIEKLSAARALNYYRFYKIDPKQNKYFKTDPVTLRTTYKAVFQDPNFAPIADRIFKFT